MSEVSAAEQREVDALASTEPLRRAAEEARHVVSAFEARLQELSAQLADRELENAEIRSRNGKDSNGRNPPHETLTEPLTDQTKLRRNSSPRHPPFPTL